MIRKLIRFGALASVVIVGACSDNSLAVSNPNQGDTKRVLGSPADAENLLGTYFKRWVVGMYGSTTDVEGMANIFALMNMSSLANNCQNSHYPFSTSTNFNGPGNTCQGEQQRLYAIMGEVNRVASSFLTAEKGGLTLGSAAQDNRDKAFAEFLNGISIGSVALMYDSLGIVSVGQSTQDPGVLISYKAAGDSAMVHLQAAIDLATAGAASFPLPATWVPSPTSYTQAEFVKLVRTYRARIRANLARTPAERAAVDWSSVIADAQNGITSDEYIVASTTAGPDVAGWRPQYDSFSTWHQMPAFIIGWADTSGNYAAWTAQDLGARGSGSANFFMATPDQRFPQGDNRTAQQNDFKIQACEIPQSAPFQCKRYFVNRPAGNDQFVGPGWGYSQYDFARFHGWVQKGDGGSARNGTTPIFVKPELDMLQAEGLYRQGNYAAAAALVNVTRQKNGLPAITAFDATSPVPGTAATCIPKVPQAPSFKTVGCGKLLDALKYEKYIETAYTAYSNWFLDERGWGDLPANSPVFWATPYQDLQARGKSLASIYGAGPGPGNAPNSIAVGPTTYGW
jgi:hypothetical protein